MKRIDLTIPNCTRDGAARAEFRRRTLAWYDRNKRDMPWRRTTDPYRVWLSEMMLQQTQVATVIPYYQRFLTRFPTVNDLASATLEEVLTMWAGLGYYARARNLHATAQAVSRDFDGHFPDTAEALRSLPGIGRYTAAAIASICFNRRAAVLDGNVARLLSRYCAIDDDIKAKQTQDAMWRIAETLAPHKRCGDFNQATMELGATVCTPRRPRCDECPLSGSCQAKRRELVDQLPRTRKSHPIRRADFVVVAIESNGRFLFESRPTKGLWGGLLQLPSREVPLDASPARTWSVARRLAIEAVGDDVRVNRKPAAIVAWKLTHRDVRFIVHRARSDRFNDADRHILRGQLLSLGDLSDAPVSTAMRRVADALSITASDAH